MINAMRRILLSRVAEITRAAQHPITRVEENSFRRLISLVNQNNLSFSIMVNTFKTLLYIINRSSNFTDCIKIRKIESGIWGLKWFDQIRMHLKSRASIYIGSLANFISCWGNIYYHCNQKNVLKKQKLMACNIGLRFPMLHIYVINYFLISSSNHEKFQLII